MFIFETHWRKMAHVKYYFAVQVILLFNLHLLSAEGEGLQDKPDKPRIVSGPGQILGISKKISVRNDETKDINNLLYAIYEKFRKDVPRHDSENKNIQRKKDVVSEASSAPVEKKREDINLNHKKETVPAKKEDRKIALRELEKTIDKLIASLSKDSDNDNLETKEINKGIKDISKFAHLSDISKDEHAAGKNSDGEKMDFESFKDAFYKTFLNKEKRQKSSNIVYHGKDDIVHPHHGKDDIVYHGKRDGIVYHGKDSNTAKKIGSQWKEEILFKKQYRDKSTKASKASKWMTLEEIKKFADLYGISTPAKKDAHVGEKNVGGMESFQDFKEKFYKTFLNREMTKKDKRQDTGYLVYHGKDNGENVAKQLLLHGKDNNGVKQYKDHGQGEITAKKSTSDFSDARMKDLVHLYDQLKKQTVAEKEEKKNIELVKRTSNEDKRSMRIAAIKKDLISLFDVSSRGTSDASRKDSFRHRHTVDEAEEMKRSPVYRKREVGEDGEKQIKRRLLTMMRSLEAELTGQKDHSHKGKDGAESELDIASRNIKTNKKENNAFMEALKGFQIPAKSSVEKDLK